MHIDTEVPFLIRVISNRHISRFHLLSLGGSGLLLGPAFFCLDENIAGTGQ